MPEPVQDPQLVTLDPQPVAVLREQVATDALPQFFARAFHAVMDVVREHGGTIVGPPVGVYFGMPTDVVDVAAGFPVDRPTSGGDVRTETLPGGQVAQLLHAGPYDTMAASYGRLAAWLETRGLVSTGVMWETYLTDVDPDAPGATLTQITWPVTAAPAQE